jgi:hypothetical protein
MNNYIKRRDFFFRNKKQGVLGIYYEHRKINVVTLLRIVYFFQILIV